MNKNNISEKENKLTQSDIENKVVKSSKNKKNSNSFEHKNVIPALFNLLGLSFFKSFRGPFFGFVMPAFFFLIFFNLLKQAGSSSTDQSLLAYLLLPGVTTITSMSQQLVVWKNSIFLRRLEVTGIPKWMFLMVLWVFYLLISLAGAITQLLVELAVASHDVIHILKTVNWGYFLLSIMLIILMSIAIATLIGGALNNEGAVQGIAMMSYFVIIFLGGVVFPPDLAESNTVMRVVSYMTPLKYPLFLMLYSTNNPSWNIVSGTKDFTAFWQPLVVSISLLAGFFTINIFTFRWSDKK